jgi:hypothetical protein
MSLSRIRIFEAYLKRLIGCFFCKNSIVNSIVVGEDV